MPNVSISLFAKRKNKILAIAAVSLFIIAAIYFYFSGLSNALETHTDENRAFHYTSSSPLIYFVCKPFIRIFFNRRAAFYVLAFFSIANVFLVWSIIKSYFSDKLAYLTAFLFLIYDYPLAYAKQLYHSNLTAFFFLLSLLFAVLSLKKNRSEWMFAAGAASGFMLCSNISSYALIPGIAGLIIYTQVLDRNYRFITGCLIRFAFALITVFSAFNYYTVRTHPNEPYFQSLFYYQKRVISAVSSNNELGLAGIARLIKTLFLSSLKSFSQFFRNVVLLFSSLGLVLTAFMRKDKKLIGFLIVFVTGALILMMGVILKVHTVDPRHFVWLSIFISFSAAYIFFKMYSTLKGRKNQIIALIFIVFVCLSILNDTALTNSLFSVNSITEYLKDHNIRKREVITLLPINTYKDMLDKTAMYATPLLPANNDIRKNGIFYIVNWPAVYHAFQQGQIKYLITSGLGSQSTVGMGDPILERVTPIAVWPHPGNNPYLHMRPTHIQIKMFDLKSVFIEMIKAQQS